MNLEIKWQAELDILKPFFDLSFMMPFIDHCCYGGCYEMWYTLDYLVTEFNILLHCLHSHCYL